MQLTGTSRKAAVICISPPDVGTLAQNTGGNHPVTHFLRQAWILLTVRYFPPLRPSFAEDKKGANKQSSCT